MLNTLKNKLAAIPRKWMFRSSIIMGFVVLLVLGKIGFDLLAENFTTQYHFKFSLPLPSEVMLREGLQEPLEVERVVVAGFFSDWNLAARNNRLEKTHSNLWEKRISLTPGVNEYKFVVFLKGREQPVWTYDRNNPRRSDDSHTGFNSVATIFDVEKWRFRFMGLLGIAGAFIALYYILEPLLHWLLRRPMPLRWKLVVSLSFYILLSNLIFIAVHHQQARRMVQEGIVDSIHFLHLLLESEGVDFYALVESEEQIDKAMGKVFWNAKVRVEKQWQLPTQITLSDIAIFNKDLQLISLHHREQNHHLQVDRARTAGFLTRQDYFVDAVFEEALKNQRLSSQTKTWFGDPGKLALMDEIETPRSYLNRKILGFSVFLYPIVIDRELLGYYAGVVQVKLYGAELKSQLRFNLLLLGLVGLMGFVLLLSIGSIFTEQLKILRGWTRGIVEGDFSLRAKIDSNDELQDLAENFEKMSLSLQQSFGEIKEKNIQISLVSHEFRTPLTLILGPVEKMLKNTDDPAMIRDLTLVQSNSNRLLRMVNQLLDVINLDVNRGMKDGFCNLSEIAKAIFQEFDPVTKQRQLLLKQEIEENCWAAISHDAAEKIVINLVSNAIKYSPENTEILLSVKHQDDEVIMVVADKGKGIAPEDSQRIFERFVRVEDVGGPYVMGSGIGLSLVKQLVERYSGKIELRSEIGIGTEFQVFLPQYSATGFPDAGGPYQVAEAKEEINLLTRSDPQDAKFSAGDGQEPADGSAEVRPTILVVEDHPEMREYIVSALSISFRCVAAENGDEGVRVALDIVPDIAITDLMMPGKSGFEFARALRDDIRTSHIPIVMLTAKSERASRMMAWENDIDEFIEKPFDMEELKIRCENLLSIREILSKRASAVISTNPSQEIQGLNSREQKFVQNLRDLVELNYQNSDLGAAFVADALAMSESQLQRKIKALLSQSVPEYIRIYRLQKAAALLDQGELISSVAYDVGFSSASYFSSCFKAHFGVSPKSFQARK